MKPSIGRMVHYVSYGTPGGEFSSTCRAAVVTAVGETTYGETTVSLCVLNPEGFFFNKGVRYHEDQAGGTWHWPEPVPEGEELMSLRDFAAQEGVEL